MRVRSSTNGFKLPEPGEYLATVSAIRSEGKKLNKYGKEQEQLRVTFQLPDGTTQPCWVNAWLSPNSKFYELVSALIAGNPPEEIETDTLVGRQCRIYIDHYTGMNGQTKSKITAYRIAPRLPKQEEVPF